MLALWRIIVYGLQGFRRNAWLSIIAIITMTLTLTTLTLFTLTDFVASRYYAEINKKIDYVIFIKDAASQTDVDSFVVQSKARPEVQGANYLNKDQVLSRFNKSIGEVDSLKDVVTADNNPLPRELDVTFHDPNQITNFDHFVHQDRLNQVVEGTTYKNNRSIIDNYTRVTGLLRVFGIFFTTFFVLIAILVILNTIRLAIFARREEIEIMRLVGATHNYIRGPFLIEGILFGLIGALLASTLFWLLLRQS